MKETELKDREEMPVYDESIFYPERAVEALGFTDKDTNDLCAYFRWLIYQKEKQERQPEELKLLRGRLLHVLRSRQTTLSALRRSELLAELDLLEAVD